jgi:hypothetical protein
MRGRDEGVIRDGSLRLLRQPAQGQARRPRLLENLWLEVKGLGKRLASPASRDNPATGLTHSGHAECQLRRHDERPRTVRRWSLGGRHLSDHPLLDCDAVVTAMGRQCDLEAGRPPY